MLWSVEQQVQSVHEPELGIGKIAAIDTKSGIVQVIFQRAQEHRSYSLFAAPIEVVNNNESKKKNIVWGSAGAFVLRRRALQIKAEVLSSSVVGLLSPRVQSLPHQLFIAKKVASRQRARFLLCDEVGLGKTVEARLVFSSLRAQGRAEKVLIVVPQGLLHQWVAEMLYKFEASFAVYNAQRYENECGSAAGNPFDNNQYIIISQEFLFSNAQILTNLISCWWDLVIIDEAHELQWQEDGDCSAWLNARVISEHCTNLLLLTATPRQKGDATQFGLLRLLDPKRYSSIDSFLDNLDDSKVAALLAAQLMSSDVVSQSLCAAIAKAYSHDSELVHLVNNKASSQQILQALLDRHGLGRALLRNRRERIRSFTSRTLHSVPLTASKELADMYASLEPKSELELIDYATGRGDRGSGRSKVISLSYHPKAKWLLDYLCSTNDKVLIICSSKQQVLALEKYLRSYAKRLFFSTFHQDLDLVTADKRAAQFVGGSSRIRILIASELGSEGRNFQTIHKVVLFDLPHHPDIIEQRIGRLDRIGQQNKQIDVVVPWIIDGPEEVLFRWYDEVLQAFSRPIKTVGSHAIDEMGEQLLETISVYLPKNISYLQRKNYLQQLLSASSLKVKVLEKEIASHIDVLGDLQSFEAKEGNALLEKIADFDDNPELELFIKDVFDYFGVDYHQIDDRGSFAINEAQVSYTSDLQDIGLTAGHTYAFDRELAVAKLEYRFLSYDSQLVERILSLFSEQDVGKWSLAYWPKCGLNTNHVLQVRFLLHCVAPKHLNIRHYLPFVSYELSLDEHGCDVSAELPVDLDDKIEAWSHSVAENIQLLINKTMTNPGPLAVDWANNCRKKALSRLSNIKNEELSRLRYLVGVNPSVSQVEVEELAAYFAAIKQCIENSVVIVDSIRLVICKP